MTLSSVSSVSGKSWIYKKFNSADINTFIEKYSLTQTVAKLLSIRNKKIDEIESFLNPIIKNLLPKSQSVIEAYKEIIPADIKKSKETNYYIPIKIQNS